MSTLDQDQRRTAPAALAGALLALAVMLAAPLAPAQALTSGPTLTPASLLTASRFTMLPTASAIAHDPALPMASAIAHDPAPAGADFVSVTEQRNTLLGRPIITGNGEVPAGTRVSSYLVAIGGPDAGEIAFNTPILAVITDEAAFADTSPALGTAAFNYASLSDFTTASKTAFTTSGKTLRYQLGGNPQEPVIIRVITAAVPEPGTWAMLIAGFGFIGALKRRQQRAILSA